MAGTSLIQGILTAFVLSLGSLPLSLGLTVLGWRTANQVLVAILAGIYIAYIIAQCTSRVGGVTLGVLSLAALSGVCFWGAPTSLVLLLAVGLIWFVRALLNYSSLISALLDGLLCALSLGGAVGTLILSGHHILAVWFFFLVQALWVFIPRRLKRATAWDASVVTGIKEDGSDTFSRAHRAAEAAIRALAQ